MIVFAGSSKKILLMILVVTFFGSTIIFGNLFLIESVKVNQLNREVEQLSDEVEQLKVNLQLQPNSGEFPDKGNISIQGIGNFQYLRVKTLIDGDPIDNIVVLRNVTFTYLGKENIGGNVWCSFDVTFQDGLSEELTIFRDHERLDTSIIFTDYNNPKAGLVFYPEQGVIYFLVNP